MQLSHCFYMKEIHCLITFNKDGKVKCSRKARLKVLDVFNFYQNLTTDRQRSIIIVLVGFAMVFRTLHCLNECLSLWIWPQICLCRCRRTTATIRRYVSFHCTTWASSQKTFGTADRPAWEHACMFWESQNECYTFVWNETDKHSLANTAVFFFSITYLNKLDRSQTLQAKCCEACLFCVHVAFAR